MSEASENRRQVAEVVYRIQPPLAFSTLGCPDWSFEELISKGREYGYSGVEIRLLQRETDLLARPEFRPSELPLRRRQLGDANFQVCGLASSVRFHDRDPAERDRQLTTCAAVGVLWDTHHPWRFHHEPLAETFEMLRPWIRHSHWKDSVARLVRKPEQQSAEILAAAQLAQQTNPGHQSADYVLFGGGEFPIRECLWFLKPWHTWTACGSRPLWYCLEWEKMWHPELEEPEVALRLFPRK